MSHRKDVETFLQGRIEELPGDPRNLTQALEEIDLCIASKAPQEPASGGRPPDPDSAV